MQALEHLVEQAADLEAREVRAEAEVRAAAAEGDVRVRVAADVEAVGVREHRLVAVRGGVEHDDLLARADRDAAELGVARGGAPELHDRRA